ncbi:MAG: hypothetical protein A3E80_05645 [Chlamydiae bacterium RIFCSPHIGHO2_12_FULL_49_9]|nr:MAG: hypothetical protein A3E80_05645 [Chlamydiae bacterium RIFCSPHIGHO2_12_FULL_49_9]
MTFPTNPIGKPPRDPYEDYRVEAVEKEKKETPQPPPEPRSPKPRAVEILVAYFLILFRKILELIERGAGRRSPSQDKGSLGQNLLLFKTSIEMMKQEDKSQSGPFLSALALDWNRLTGDLRKMSAGGPIEIELRALIQKIQSYPKGTQHSFGYYLSEYAGQKWLPFPFMEMVQKAHFEHRKDPSHSALSDWSAKLDHLLSLLETYY